MTHEIAAGDPSRHSLRSFAFNILKANRRGSFAQDRLRAAIAGLASLLKLLRFPER